MTTASEEFARLASRATQMVCRVADRHHAQNQVIAFEEVVPEYDASRPLATVQVTAWKPERFKDARPNAAFIAWCFNNRALIQRALEVCDGTAFLKNYAPQPPQRGEEE